MLYPTKFRTSTILLLCKLQKWSCTLKVSWILKLPQNPSYISVITVSEMGQKMDPNHYIYYIYTYTFNNVLFFPVHFHKWSMSFPISKWQGIKFKVLKISDYSLHITGSLTIMTTPKYQSGLIVLLRST
jgi:hypothetical protein